MENKMIVNFKNWVDAELNLIHFMIYVVMGLLTGGWWWLLFGAMMVMSLVSMVKCIKKMDNPKEFRDL